MTTQRSSQLIGAMAGLGAVAVLAAGCGSSSPTASTAASGKEVLATAYKYSRCMREHGVPSFPDPQPSGNGGQLSISLTVTPATTESPAFSSARQSCQAFQPGPGYGGPTNSGQESAQHAAHLLAFARCMRSHGVGDFPDPSTQGRITLSMLRASGIDLHAEYVLHAAVACLPSSGGVLTKTSIANVEQQIAP